MRADPRKGCANERELWLWAAIHDLVAHPLMVLTWYSLPAMWFHDFTSRKAWPRPVAPQMERMTIAGTMFGIIVTEQQSATIWRVRHGLVDHAITVKAHGPGEAMAKGMGWFMTLADELGGNFKRLGT